MTSSDKNLKLSDEQLARLIDQTITSMGPIDPAKVPHLVRERLGRQIRGDFDLDAYLRQRGRESAPRRDK